MGAEGEIVRTRRGELSVLVEEWVLLATSRQGFGDKWRGVQDTELRYRQREVALGMQALPVSLLQPDMDVLSRMNLKRSLQAQWLTGKRTLQLQLCVALSQGVRPLPG